jgi:hypothetical protein
LPGERRKELIKLLFLAKKGRVQAADGSWIAANVFANEGSDTTLMRTAFASSLKLQGSSQVLTVDGTGGVINKNQSKLVQFQLRAESGEVVPMEGSTMELVASPTPITDWSKGRRTGRIFPTFRLV